MNKKDLFNGDRFEASDGDLPDLLPDDIPDIDPEEAENAWDPTGYLRYCKELSAEELSRRKNGDYAINELQLEKFFSLYEYMLDKISELNSIFGASSAWLSRVSVIPKEEDGMISVVLPLFILPGEEIPAFMEKLRDCSAFQIDPRDNDTVEITCFIPDIFFPI